jgi:L-amino acid N-acyltransferase YncA
MHVSLYVSDLSATGFRTVGYRERIGQLHGIWRNTLLLERRSTVVGGATK